MKGYDSGKEKGIFMGFLMNFIYLLVLIILLFLLLYFAYLLYLNLPGEPQNFDVVDGDYRGENQTPKNLQFSPNMKFNHNNISYYIYPDCDKTKVEKIVKAFSIISEKVELIEFYSTYENPDIEVVCSKSNFEPTEESLKRYYIAGEGGAKEIVKSGDFNIITNGTILLYKYPFEIRECNVPVVELHETLHVFGFDHSQNEESLMNSYLVSCMQDIDPTIINELKRLYSIPNLAELYFENLKAVKKGRYLDFNLTIKNYGLVDANNTVLSILDDGELAEDREIKELKYGAGIIIQVENLKLIHRNPKKITFIIDRENSIEEFDKKNNIAEINIGD